ncbi:WD40 repeat domain-containing serine/threonine protein kinase [Nonomuraea sp. NEAU-A123]|uniref:WD40 repeat domain-containing serine/threonine protein kinase n=1 Tax=Nonomuraea sp. NEAU-A123 TaxID=2839649 RepID=UPI001BE431C7|nr:WD40 repeat domain-containing serine/threonine protein kinase [Nonomuraea sp. NEAU-A123]MBT2232168.1 protein kinase [Nonomuraea sp. NEAU-A123]
MASALLPGDPPRLGDFWLAGRLGAGGQGVVYEAYDPQGVRVAIKVLHGDAVGDRGLRARFGKEAAAAQRVASFCTARVLAVDLDAPKPYLVSEYVEGPSLRQSVDGGRRFSGDELHRLATAVATALTAIHDAGVVHRDLKPDNVLLGPDGPRVIDFGVARTPEMSLTTTGQVTGTPTYMAPEVFTGQRAGAPADVFAWGAIVVYTATGDDPFRAENLGAVMHRVLLVEPDLTALPRSLRSLVSAALAKDPVGRPTARELLLGLVSGFQGSQADLLTVGSAEAGLLDRGAPADPTLGALADDAYGFLEPAERDLVPDLFLRLVNVTDTGEVTVRAASREELSEARTPQEQAALERILEVFAYLVITRGDDITLARPALVQAWPRLRSWVGDERDGLPMHDMIRTGARHWNAHGRREGDVFQGSRLETALRWAATGRRHLTLSKLERDFLDACNAATRNRVRRRRLLTVALAVLLVLALAGGGVALRQSRLVSEQSRIVAAQRDEAVAGKVAAQADTMRATDPVRAMLLSVAAWRLAPVSATRATLENAWAQRERAAFTDPDTGAETVRQLTADGRTFVSVSPQGVRIYDVRTGKRIGGWNDLKMGADRFLGADLSPSGRLLAVAAGHAITIWDTSTGRQTGARRKIDVPGFFNGVQFLTGDRYVNVVGSQGGDLWDLRTGATVSARAGMLRPAVTPAGDLVVNVDLEKHFQLLRLPSGKPVARWHDGETCGKDGQVAAISPDGHTVACGTGSNISFVDLRTGRTLPNRASTGWDANGDGQIWFSPDGRYLVSGGVGRFVLVRVSDGDTLLDYRAAPQNVVFDGTTLRYLADETVVSLDISDLVHPVRLPGRTPEAAVFSPDGRFLATQQQAESRQLVLWDVVRRRPLGSPLKITIGDGDMALAFSGDGRLLASIGGLGQRLQMRDTSQPSHVSEARLPGNWTASTMAVNGNGTLVAVGASDTNDDLEGTGHSRVFVWDVPHHTWMRSVDTGNLSEVVFRPGSPMMVPVVNSGNHLIDLSTGRPVGPGFGPGGLNGRMQRMAFSPDGATLATGDDSGRLAFWDVATGDKHGPTLRANPNDGVGITQIIFSPKGDVAASIGAGQVQLWDVATPRKLGPSMAVDQNLVSAAFGSGGAVLHTLDDTGVLRDMSVGPEATAATICARAGRGLTRADWQRYLPGVPYREVCP